MRSLVIGTSSKHTYTPGNADIKINIIGIDTKGNEDSLAILELSKIDSLYLGNVNTEKYSSIRLKADFKISNSGESPVLKNMIVDFKGLPELGVNYQTFTINKDTLYEGENLVANFNLSPISEKQQQIILTF